MRKSRVLIGLAWTIMIIFFINPVLIVRANSVPVMQVPSQVQNAQYKREIDVYYNNQVVNYISVYLEKQKGLDKGWANFTVKGYAYGNLTNTTLGVLFGYYTADGSWKEDFLENVGTHNAGEQFKGRESEWNNEAYKIIVESLPLMQGQEQNKGQTQVAYRARSNYKDTVFTDRYSSKSVKLGEKDDLVEIVKRIEKVEGKNNQWDVKVQVRELLSESNRVDTVIVLDVPSSNKAQGICKNTLDNVLNPLLKVPGSKVSLVLEGEEVINYIGPTSIDDNTLSKLVQEKIKENNKTNADLFNANSIQKARAILAADNVPNQSIVIVSYEGANCKGESNGNSGKGDCVELTQSNREAIITQMGAASAEGISIYTFAAHGMKGENKAHISPLQKILKENTNGKFYATEFAETSLKADSQAYMTEIATLINRNQNVQVMGNATNLVYNDKLVSQFKIISPNLIDTSISEDSTEMVWHVGQLSQGQEKMLSYRIEMIEGNIGTSYLVSEQVKLQYTNQEGQSVSVSDISNPFVKAAWAKLTINSKDDKGMVLKKEDGTPYSTGIWVDVKDVTEGDAININLSNAIDPNTMELTNSGTSTIANFITILQYQCIGEQVTQGQYNLKPTIVVTQIKSEKTLFYNKTTSGISNVSDTKGHNLIVPDSVSNIFWVTTFDDEYKSISYEIDLASINDKIILNTSVLAVGINPGTFKKNEDYFLTVSDKTIKLTFKDTEKTISELTNNTMKQEITVYIPTQLSNSIPYDKGINSYKNVYLNQSAEVAITVKGRKRSIIQEVLEDGTIVNRIIYPDTPSEIIRNTDSIKVTFKEMPRIS